MTVRALLDGHQFDLHALAELFPDGDLRVCVHPEEAGRYCLEASELEPLFADPSEMHETATAILVRLTGAARLEDDSCLVGRYDLHLDRRHRHRYRHHRDRQRRSPRPGGRCRCRHSGG
jgi:hypothetical protein